MELISEDPANFHGTLRLMDFGAVQLSQVTCSNIRTLRTKKQISQSDPDMFQLIIPLHGHGTITQDRNDVAICPSSMVFYNTWRPYSMSTVGDDGIPIRGIFAMLPRTLLRLPAGKVEQRLPRVFSRRDGIDGLLPGLLGHLVAHADRFRASDATRLGATVIDLLTALLAHEHGVDASTPPETRQRALITQIHAFIHQRLGDPTLSPETIAAAHHISVRSLHRLFQAQERTLTAWIRDRRPGHCGRDLADPRLGDRPIHAIAARWGFTSAAHFTRLFRAAHGITPQDYRRQHHSFERTRA